MKNKDTVLHVATRKGLFRYELGASAWELAGSSFLGENLSLVHVDPRDGTVYAALDTGHFGPKLHRSEDGGATFEEIGLPSYPEMPEGWEEKPQFDGKPIAWSLRMIWSFAHGGDDQPGRLWIGSIPGGLFRSDDRGATWQLVESLWMSERRKEWLGGGADAPGIHSICVDPRDSKRVVLGVSCGGVWRTNDDGATWEQKAHGMRAEYCPPEQAYEPWTQDPHCVVQCRDEPTTFWAQHHNGIFVSTNDLESWEEIEGVQPSVFGFPVAVHPQDGKRAWFVPAQKDQQRIPKDARVVVTRTKDGGKSFDVLDRGLPAPPAYDLVYRHALDIDASGERLAFGSTTGSLWATTDGGENWSTLSTHLPPVYAVRFADR
ncbi:MAG: exo-alpha-sialidase [Planctomycetes bacterium]|nr:exo-alpha-sialidase [Planctomycetota bacterium]